MLLGYELNGIPMCRVAHPLEKRDLKELPRVVQQECKNEDVELGQVRQAKPF